jgi:hypothetical protein
VAISSIFNSTGLLRVGSRDPATGSPLYFNGWIDEVRISKGIARWTSNFTPPTAPYSVDDPNTVLVLHADGADASTTFTDSSGYGHT